MLTPSLARGDAAIVGGGDRGAAPLERQFREIESPNIHFGERVGDRMKGA